MSWEIFPVPLSRKRPTKDRQTRSGHPHPLALDRVLDRTVDASRKIPAPPVLYHYTKWKGAEGILTSQTIRATAHDCTKDKAELVSADDVIIEVAKALRTKSTGVAHAALTLFLEGYPTRQITKLMTVYLACFSVARDDRNQWLHYGDEGHGVCLGFRMLDEPEPKIADQGSDLIKVDYSEQSWRASIKRHFTQVCEKLRRAALTEANVGLGMLAFYRIAGFKSISAKQEQWAKEQEYRRVTLIHKDAKANPEETDESGRRYVPVMIRADGKRMALAEVIIGPDQDANAGRKRLEELLATAGYQVDDPEYPTIIQSTLPTAKAPTAVG